MTCHKLLFGVTVIQEQTRNTASEDGGRKDTAHSIRFRAFIFLVLEIWVCSKKQSCLYLVNV